MTGSRRLSILAFTTAACLLAPPAMADGLPRSPMRCSPAPLLQPGKTQLVERVLVRTSATLSAAPGAKGDKVIPAFSVLYIYDRSPDGKSVQVGVRSDCHPDGWMAAESVVPWRHAIVAAFAPRTSRDRTLFLQDRDSILSLVQSANPGAEAQKLLAAEQGPSLVSVEPKLPVDIKSHFYLMPVLDAEKTQYASNKPVRLLHVAAITEKSDQGAGPAPGPDVRRNFRMAVVFVMDTTKSTQPYIDRMRASLDKLYDKVEAAHFQDQVRFGVIGFRDDPKAVPGIGYLTNTFVDPNKVDNRRDFDRLTADLKAATISTRAESEDTYAGVLSAINDIDWSGFSARFIVLMTDAGARDPGPISSTNYDAHHLKMLAQDKQTPVSVVHLLTPEGSDADHRKGRKQYTELAAYDGMTSLYYPIQGGQLNQFGNTVEQFFGASLVSLLNEAEESGGPLPKHAKPDAAVPEPASPEENISAIAHAMRLAYLGKVSGSRAPGMFDAWGADRDFTNQTIPSLNPYILLTKTQLSDLQATVSALAKAFNNSMTDPTQLFSQLRGAALGLARGGQAIAAAHGKDMTKVVLGEYLDGLPYTSTVMAVDEEQWASASPAWKSELIDGLEQKARIYQHAHDDVANWINLAEGANPDDAVHLIRLDELP